MSLLDFEKEPSALAKLALRLPARLFRTVAEFRSALYDRGTFHSVKTDLPVISVGNLTTGGTGKTPIVSYLTEQLTLRGKTVSIVSRGYGATEKGPALVPNSGDEAERFGDEPSWLAKRHPKSHVVVGVRRPEAVGFLRNAIFKSSSNHKSIVIADDAFQHRRLAREIDIVVIDASAPSWHYESLPLGRMREDFSALERADFVFLSKVNMANAGSVLSLRAKLTELSAVHKFKIIEFGAVLDGVRRLDQPDEQMKSLKESLGGPNRARVVLMSALARPQSFEDLLGRSEQIEIVKHFKFPDHAKPSESDLRAVESAAIESDADAIVITEKDAIKLGTWRPKKPCFITQLRAEPFKPSELGGFYEAVDRLT